MLTITTTNAMIIPPIITAEIALATDGVIFLAILFIESFKLPDVASPFENTPPKPLLTLL